MSSITPLRFTGVSSFSQDFESIMTRASQIAALPVKQLQSNESTLLGKKQALAGINSSLQSLTSAVETLGRTGRTRSLTITSSNTSRVTVVNKDVTAATSYVIDNITSVAKAASETTVAGLPTANTTEVDPDGQLELAFGSKVYALDVSATGKNNLEGLRDAINSSGAEVTATILSTGSNNYLSVTARSTGAATLQVRTTAGDGASNLLTSANQGANAIFRLNGVPVEKSDNVISDVVPGLTFTIQGKTDPGETVNLTAQSTRGDTATALGALVTAYNAVADKVNGQIGERAGLLSGDNLVRQVGGMLRQLTGYRGTGAVKSLVDLGIELDKTGKMTFDSAKFYSLPTSSIEGAFDFFGSESTGFGGQSHTMDQLANPVTGMIRLQQDSYDSADLRIQNQVNEINTRSERSQALLALKLQQADALLATLQSQQSTLEANLKGVLAGIYGKSS